MFNVLAKRQLSEAVFEITVEAPEIARKVQAGQFLIIRATEDGERVPFTFSDWSAEEGWIKFIFMKVGKTSHLISHLERNDVIADVAGPLGNPTEIEDKSRIAVIGGGVGCAVAYPVARALCDAGAEVTVIMGARKGELLILKEEFEALPLKDFIIMTDDGSAGEKGLVTAPLGELCKNGELDNAFAVGPAIMMKFCAATTGEYGVPTAVSLNPIMVDGTGMCGACRVTVFGETKFGCVDGPDFDAAGVNWNELMTRQRLYQEEERVADAEYAGSCSCHI
ncbi:MAG: sulfide/dihydroorotate dehydrogenase-like FAD/NAD-binding protein [Coriobacteriia bacterium]|nr:sulfide/dihydroorotate dehydrogenase-like FAD/NAD-binding protein [Coriobacteriia bacterium]